MPTSYGIHREADGILSWSFVDQRLTEARNYWIVTSSPTGEPHAAPVWGVWIGGVLMFGTDADSVKGRNIANRPELIVHLESGDDAVIVHGVASEMVEPEAKVSMAVAYGAKYGYHPLGDPPDPSAPGLFYEVHPQRVLAWREHDFPHTATRWRVD